MAASMKRPFTHGPRDPLLDGGDLFRTIISRRQLEAGWARVWKNAGAAGGDNITVHQFARDAWPRISRLRHQLREGGYRPGPLRRVQIPKRSGKGMRTLAIPCVADRIVQCSAALVLTPLLDAEFEPASFGYRPERSVKQAVAQISTARAQGYDWVVDADIENYFDTIAHDRLMERWEESVSGGPLSELVRQWLTHAEPDGRGIAQGSPLSPLLANLYLDRLDEALYGRGMRLVRFADDFVVLCRSRAGAEGAMNKVAMLLKEHGLKLNRDKSRIVDFERGFRFLGHLFVRSMVMKTSPEKADLGNIEKIMREIARKDARARADARAEAMEEARREALGYSPGLRNLYVLERGRRLNVRNQAFSVEQGHGGPSEEYEWRELIAIPHQQVDRIDIGPHVSVSNEALRHALATNTPLAFVNGHGETLGWASDTLAPRASRHLEQARLALDDGARLELARIIVDARLRNQRTLLRRLLANREDRPEAVMDALLMLNKTIGRGDKSRIRHAGSVEALMGFEGACTHKWWKGLSALAHPDFAFAKRDRDRGSDPANICINFLAWLLNRDISVAVMRAGLHPGFGALHAVSDRRDACVYDLMEEFRAHLVGGLFVYVSNRRIIRPRMFSTSGRAVRMKGAGGNALVRAYESRVGRKVKNPRTGKRVTWRRLMVEQAFAMAGHVEGLETYSPFLMDERS